MTEKKVFSRLPKDVIPSNYKLRLKPDLAAFTFEGHEDITVEVKKSTDFVILNCADIKVQKVTYSGNGQELNDVNFNITEDEEAVTFKFPEPLKEGSGTLSVTYTGELNDKMKGFYRNKYTTPEGEERFGATTQFEATDARRAFPCWDEPSVKATFDVTLVVPKNRVALSNMPITEEKEEGDLKVVSYERTPVMSTYLLAFVIGEYDYLEDKDSDGVLVRVYTPVGKKEQGRFALEVAVKTLPFYKDYFNIAYPLPKMDLIAIQDFAAGAMENWGLVTYRETALLIDPENSSSAAKQLVALVVGHEIAHQWFGNLVTMEWWTHLWLNEGFASWIEYLCVDHCFPEYDIWTQFASTDYTRALELDALNNSHPIEVPVGHPSEVDEIFDAISYSKGASVIRMLHNYIGDEDFRKGMHNYLNKHKYTNTFTEDLWAALGDASGKPVQEIMTSWTKQMGFPVLKVSQKVEGDKRHVTVAQEKFCSDGHQPGDGALWMVPVSISTSSDPTKVAHTFTLDKKEMTVTMENVKADEWIKVNTGGVGFYRTSYEPDMLQQLLPAVRDRSLPPRDRLGLHSDLFALARAGVTSTADFLQVAEAYVNEDNFTVWSDLSTNLGQLSTLLQYTDQHETYQKFVCKLFGPIAEKLGWDAKPDEGHLDALLRSVVIGKLGRNKHQPTIDEARTRFAKHVDGSCHLVADLRGPVYSTVLSNGDGEVFESMLKLFRAADLHEERVRILRSLGSVQTEGLIQKVLDFSLSDEVRSQDSVFVVTGVTGSVAGRDLAWKFIQDRWKELSDRYTGGFLLARLIKRTTEDFATQDKAKEIETFFKQNSAPAAERTIQQSLEQIEINRKQLEKDSAAIKAFLEKSLS